MTEKTELQRIGRAVAEERRRRGWTQAELAFSANMSSASVWHIERGDVGSTRTLLEALDVLGLSLAVKVPSHVHSFERVCRLCGARAS